MDANLLVLFIVGSVGRELIAKHRRLREYTTEDYDMLIDFIEAVDHVLVTPNTLTEASNLLSQHGEPERSRFFKMLRFMIESTQEVVIFSKAAESNPNFERFGLTDAALLEAISEDTPLLTADLYLYAVAMKKSRNTPTAVNFTALRNP